MAILIYLFWCRSREQDFIRGIEKDIRALLVSLVESFLDLDMHSVIKDLVQLTKGDNPSHFSVYALTYLFTYRIKRLAMLANYIQ